MDSVAKTAIETLVPCGVALFRLDGAGYHALFLNRTVLERYGKSGEEVSEIFGREAYAELVHPDDADRFSLMLYKGGVTGGLFSETVRLKQKNGSYSWTDLRLNAVPEDGGAALLCFSLIDVDGQKENELKLERTYEELLGVMNNTPGGIVVFNTKNNRDPYPSFVSLGMFRLLRGSRREIAELYGRNFYAAVHPEDREMAVRVMEDAIRNLSPFQVAVRLYSAAGEEIWAEASGTVQSLEGNRNVYVSFTDASADRKTQRTLKNILDLFARRQYDIICLVDAGKRNYRILSRKSSGQRGLPAEGDDYEAAADKVAETFFVPAEREKIREEIRLENLTSKLEKQEDLELFLTVRTPGGELRHKKMWASWADRGARQMALVISDYTELRRQQIEQQNTLLAALQAAEQASVAKSSFLSRMSHDIRTPLNAIIGFTQIGLADPGEPPESRDRLAKIASASGYLLSLVNDVLDMSRIESGKLSLNPEIFSMDGLLGDVHSVIFAQCEEKKLEYRCEKAENVRRFYIGDRLKLQQVLINLLGNSVKFTEPGGRVLLSVKENAAYGSQAVLQFRVRDTGVGIAETFLPHLFETFSQENGGVAAQTGTGLGLAICKSLVAMMNGNIRAESQKGSGTEFVAEVQLEIPKENGVSGAAGTDARKPRTGDYRFDGKRILLAEDNLMNQEIAKYLLEKVGFAVELACDGRVACEKFAAAEERFYDAVILDIRMPVMDGLQTARTIRGMARQDAKTVPLIAMSADAFEEDISKSLTNGINAHLIKPIDADALYQTLWDYLD